MVQNNQLTQYQLKPKKMRDAPKFLKIPKSGCPDFWMRLPRHWWPKPWSNIEDRVVPLERSLYGHPLAGLLWERQSEKALLGQRCEKVPNWECVCLLIENKYYSCRYTWMTSKWLEESRIWVPCGRNWWKTLILENQHHFLTTCIWDVLNVNVNQTRMWLRNAEKCSNHKSLLEQLKKLLGWEKPHAKTVVVLRHGESCEKVRWKKLWTGEYKDWAKVSTPCLDDQNFEKEELETVGELSWNACTWHELVEQTFYCQWTKLHELSQNGQELVTNAWFGSFWYPTFITRAITGNIVIGNTAQQCRLGLFQDSDFAWDLEDSKPASGENLCICGSHTFVPISWMCKKQTSVSHSSTESEVISLDAGLCMDGIPALDLRDLEIEVLHSSNNVPALGNQSRNESQSKQTNNETKTKKHVYLEHDEWSNVDHVVTSAKPSHFEAMHALYFRRQWSCDHDDHQRPKSDSETRVQNPQSCSWLAVRSN